MDLRETLERTGLAAWQWAQAIAMDLIPTEKESRQFPFTATWPHTAAWPRTVVDEAVKRKAEILTAVGNERPIGEDRAAERLEARTGLAVTEGNVATLTEDGLLTVVAEEREGWPLWACSGLDALPYDQAAKVVGEREAWFERSVTLQEAAQLLGWQESDVDRLTDDLVDLTCMWERYARSDIEALARGSVRVQG
jgi:hypothetical protein